MPLSPDLYITPWAEFLDDDFDWNQSEYVTLIGTVGQGKTTLELELVGQRDHVLWFGTKTEDETQEELGPLGFRTARKIADIVPDISHKWIINPGVVKGESVSSMKARQRSVYQEAMMYAFHTGGWCLVLDEGRYITDYLGLKDEVTLIYLQGRSHYVSIVMGTQRPAWVPLEAFDQATHLFFWRDNDSRNIARISELSGLRRQEVMQIVPSLEQHQFLYCNTRTDRMVISKVER